MGIVNESKALLDILEKFNLLQKILKFFKKGINIETLCDDYYYQEYNKKVFVRKNGDCVIVSSFKLTVIDPLKTSSLTRTLDIHDAKTWAKFDDFEEMKNRDIDEIFTKYGFWYISDNSIVTDVEEYYAESDKSKATDDKFISIKMSIDTTKLEPGHTYNLSYAFSIPGLYPLLDGRFDTADQSHDLYGNFKSYISTNHIGHHLRYALYLENGIDIKVKPQGHVIRSKILPQKKKKKKKGKNNANSYNCEFKDNIFYTKYWFEVENPQEYESIYMSWDIKNPKQSKQRKEEILMEKEGGI